MDRVDHRSPCPPSLGWVDGIELSLSPPSPLRPQICRADATGLPTLPNHVTGRTAPALPLELRDDGNPDPIGRLHTPVRSHYRRLLVPLPYVSSLHGGRPRIRARRIVAELPAIPSYEPDLSSLCHLRHSSTVRWPWFVIYSAHLFQIGHPIKSIRCHHSSNALSVKLPGCRNPNRTQWDRSCLPNSNRSASGRNRSRRRRMVSPSWPMKHCASLASANPSTRPCP